MLLVVALLPADVAAEAASPEFGAKVADGMCVVAQSGFLVWREVAYLMRSSLDLCARVREGRKLHVKVHPDTPLFVWSARPRRARAEPEASAGTGEGEGGGGGEAADDDGAGGDPPAEGGDGTADSVEVADATAEAPGAGEGPGDGGEQAAGSGGESSSSSSETGSSREKGAQDGSKENGAGSGDERAGAEAATPKAAGDGDGDDRPRLRRTPEVVEREQIHRTSRVAPLNISRITWDRTEQDLRVQFASELPRELEMLTFGFAFNGMVDGVKVGRAVGPVFVKAVVER